MKTSIPVNSRAVAIASLLLSPMAAFAALSANMDVTSGGVTQTYQSTLPAANVLTLGNAQASLQFSSTPGCVGLACAIDGPAMGASLGAGGPFSGADANAHYSFSIVGAPAAVPILVSGEYAVIDPFEFPDRSGGTVATGLVDIRGSRGALFNFQSLCYDYAPENNEQAPAQNCGTGSFQGSFLAAAGSIVLIYMDATVSRSFADAGLPAASAYIDPFFEIDPVWAATHPGYSLTFDPGVGDGMPGAIAPVPEPATIALLAGGLIALAGKRRRSARATGLA